MDKQLRLKIYGKVQGVSFRMNTRQKAVKLGLTGWVRNNDDGTVTLVAQGQKRDLEEFKKWARVGPTLARVKKVDLDWQEIEQEFDDFTIRY